MAINKDRIVQHHQQPRGAGEPAAAAARCPATIKDYTGYAYDSGRRQGAARRGRPSPTASRPSSTSCNTDPNPRIAQAIQQDLAAIGIKAELKSLAQANVIAAGGNGTRADDLVGRHGAGSPTSPIRPTSTARSSAAAARSQGGWNWSWYCNEDARQARRPRPTRWSIRPRPTEREQAVGRRSSPKIMEDAPWAPVFNEQRFTMHSPRMGGDDALYVDPVHIPIELRLRVS